MASQQSVKNVKWVEGLRGITSVLVVVTHIARAFDYPLFFPKDAEDVPARLLQLPILRVPAQGRIGVPIFAFLTGFVCALKPLKLARKGSQGQGEALVSVAKSAFRRPPRLILPAMIATLISFVLTYMGGYVSANHCDSLWVRFDAPGRRKTLSREVRRLFHSLFTTWTNSDNPYDRHQWAMRPLLIGAFQVYIVLAATMGMRFRYRVTVHLLLMSYWWMNRNMHTETFGSMIALGTLLADLSLHRPTQNFIASHHRILSLAVAPLLILTGLYIGSYPQEHEDWAPWSRQLQHYFVNMEPPEGMPKGSFLIPEGTDPRRRLTAAGIQLCCIAIFLSPMLREALSNKYLLWLGQHSFAVYLTHGTILRTVGIWVAYGITGKTAVREDGTKEEFTHITSHAHAFVAICVFVSVTYTAAWAWMRWVDTACARATQWLEGRVFAEEDDESEVLEKGFAGNGNSAHHMNGFQHRSNNSVSHQRHVSQSRSHDKEDRAAALLNPGSRIMDQSRNISGPLGGPA